MLFKNKMHKIHVLFVRVFLPLDLSAMVGGGYVIASGYLLGLFS